MSILEWLSTISLALGILVIIGKWLIVAPLKNFIKEQTYPLQPFANGGRSLPDIAQAVNRIERRLDEHMAQHAKDN